MENTTEHWIEQTCLTRLAGIGHRGLSEQVLCAIVGQQAKNTDNVVIAPDVRRALKRLKESDRVHHSAGRWRLA